MADATINIYGITDLETVWWGGIACSVDYISIGNSGRLVLGTCTNIVRQIVAISSCNKICCVAWFLCVAAQSDILGVLETRGIENVGV